MSMTKDPQAEKSTYEVCECQTDGCDVSLYEHEMAECNDCGGMFCDTHISDWLSEYRCLVCALASIDKAA